MEILFLLLMIFSLLGGHLVFAIVFLVLYLISKK